MTTRIKEKIVALSRSKRVNKFFYIYLIVAIILVVISKNFFTSIRLLNQISWIVAMLGIFIGVLWVAIEAIKKHEDEIIYKNSLIYLILSDDYAVEQYLIWIVCFVILPIISKWITINFITGAIFVVVTLTIIIKLSNIISICIKNKLSK